MMKGEVTIRQDQEWRYYDERGSQKEIWPRKKCIIRIGKEEKKIKESPLLFTIYRL